MGGPTGGTGIPPVNANTRRRHAGMALLTVMWVLALLLILVGGMLAMTHSEMAIARNLGGLTGARQAAHAGIHRAEAAVLNYATAVPPFTTQVGAQVAITGPDDPNSLDGATYTVNLQDEAGKLNLNNSAVANVTTLSAFFPPDVAANIIAWRDPAGTDPTTDATNGDAYYTSLPNPYQCKHAPFSTVNELLLVQGVTPDMLAATVTDDGLTLGDLLTVSSFDNNTDMAGQPRVNLTTATQNQLANLQAAGTTTNIFTTADAAAIISQRGRTPFHSPADLLAVTALAKTKVASAYDRLTCTTARVRNGLVNVNTASEQVLAALPGMDDTTAQAIVQWRTAQGPLPTVGQLLLADGVSITVFRAVADLLTTRSTAYRVVATGQNAKGMALTASSLFTVITNTDGSSGICTQYWHE